MFHGITEIYMESDEEEQVKDCPQKKKDQEKGDTEDVYTFTGLSEIAQELPMCSMESQKYTWKVMKKNKFWSQKNTQKNLRTKKNI